METWEVNLYTARWTHARLRGTFPLPNVGEKVRVDNSCDAREWGDLSFRLREEGRALEFVEADGRWNVYDVVPRTGGEDE